MKKNIALIVGIVIIVIAAFIVWQNKTQAPEANTSVQQEQTTPTENTTTPETKKSGFNATEVATHNSVSSCYVIVGAGVYDLTDWIAKHPGGADNITKLCGTDGTELFTKQHGSFQQAKDTLASYLIGDLIN